MVKYFKDLILIKLLVLTGSTLYLYTMIGYYIGSRISSFSIGFSGFNYDFTLL